MLKSGEQQGLPLSCAMVPAIDEKGCGTEETFSVLIETRVPFILRTDMETARGAVASPRRGQLSHVIALFA